MAAKKVTKKAIEQVTEEKIVIPQLTLETFYIGVESTPGSSYIPHRLAIDKVRDFSKNLTPKPKVKAFRNLDAEYEECFYQTPEGKYGVNYPAFQAAVLDASVACDVKKTQIKRAFRLIGDIAEFEDYDGPKRREDIGRDGSMKRTPLLIVRPEFYDWKTTLRLQLATNLMSVEQAVNLLNMAGFTSGVGDWRPSSPRCPGTHGMFSVTGYTQLS